MEENKMKCSRCGKSVNEKNNYLELGLGKKLGIVCKARIRIDYAEGYRNGYGESNICKECRVAIMGKLFYKLESEGWKIYEDTNGK